MRFIPNPTMILAAVLLLIATLLGGASLGMKYERQKWQAEKIELEEAKARELQTEFTRYARAHKFNEEKARKATETHEKALADLGAKHLADVAAIKRAGGLRIPANVCPRQNTGTAEASGPRGFDESAAASIRLPTAIEDDLFGIVHDADKLSEQLRALQGWIRDNGFYGEVQ